MCNSAENHPITSLAIFTYCFWSQEKWCLTRFQNMDISMLIIKIYINRSFPSPHHYQPNWCMVVQGETILVGLRGLIEICLCDWVTAATNVDTCKRYYHNQKNLRVFISPEISRCLNLWSKKVGPNKTAPTDTSIQTGRHSFNCWHILKGRQYKYFLRHKMVLGRHCFEQSQGQVDETST